MDERAQLSQVIVFQSPEGFVLGNFSDSVFLERTDRDDLALAFDGVHNIAESILLGEAFVWDFFVLEGAWTERDLVGEARLVNNLPLAFPSEEGLNLGENVAQFRLWVVQE